MMTMKTDRKNETDNQHGQVTNLAVIIMNNQQQKHNLHNLEITVDCK